MNTHENLRVVGNRNKINSKREEGKVPNDTNSFHNYNFITNLLGEKKAIVSTKFRKEWKILSSVMEGLFIEKRKNEITMYGNW